MPVPQDAVFGQDSMEQHGQEAAMVWTGFQDLAGKESQRFVKDSDDRMLIVQHTWLSTLDYE